MVELSVLAGSHQTEYSNLPRNRCIPRQMVVCTPGLCTNEFIHPITAGGSSR